MRVQCGLAYRRMLEIPADRYAHPKEKSSPTRNRTGILSVLDISSCEGHVITVKLLDFQLITTIHFV